MVQLQIALSALCGVTALLVLVQIARDRLVNRVVLGLLALIEVGLVVHLVLGIGWLTGDRPDIPALTYFGYLVGSLAVLPLAAGWAWAERSRSGTAVILVGLVVVPYLFVRLHDIATPPA
ncbi:hypothetical protein [Intrasporangium sp.]|uniref:hypothetical protein n=1 Tax=Intrasporangium sp. TaxID=1925024 RepID=UPI002939B347|nr:hypothetical protein [Intrasporangium sp.]MDV3222584.1 hypothetical protein [Intrasporangium sp.]